MTSAHSILRTLLIYAICVPLAVFLGYLMTNPLDRGTFITLALVLGLLSLPLLIRYHNPLMLFAWNTSAVLFFLPGRPGLWMAAIAISFMISFTQRILNKEVKAISVPGVSRALIVLVLIILVTAKLTGGIGLRSFGGDVYGGKKYMVLLFSILGFFALAAYRIPRERVNLCIGLFFLSGVSVLVGDLYPVLGGTLPFLFWLIPPYSTVEGFEIGTTRFAGLPAMSGCIFAFMLARYGIRGMFLANRPWRAVAFIFFAVIGLYGGFRSLLINYLATFALQFYLEGLHRTKLLPMLGLVAVLGCAALLPFASHLPPTIQRSLAFLPVTIDPMVRRGAEASSEWRVQMWKAVLPQVPQYLWLGKGMALSHEDFDYSQVSANQSLTEDNWGSALAGDYHNGPLSVVIPFGIWGVLAFIWFQIAAFRVVNKNYRYGDPNLHIINSYLLANYAVRVVMFWVIVGGFTSDILQFVGCVGLSVAFNGGVARRSSPVTEAKLPPVKDLANVLPRQRPVFGR